MRKKRVNEVEEYLSTQRMYARKTAQKELLLAQVRIETKVCVLENLTVFTIPRAAMVTYADVGPRRR